VSDGTEMFNTMSNFNGIPSGHPFSQYLLGRSIRRGRGGDDHSRELSAEDWQNRERFATFQHQLAMQGLTHQTNEGLRLSEGTAQSQARLYAAQGAVDDAVAGNTHGRAQEAAILAHQQAMEAAEQAHKHTKSEAKQAHKHAKKYATHITDETIREDAGIRENERGPEATGTETVESNDGGQQFRGVNPHPPTIRVGPGSRVASNPEYHAWNEANPKE